MFLGHRKTTQTLCLLFRQNMRQPLSISCITQLYLFCLVLRIGHHPNGNCPQNMEQEQGVQLGVIHGLALTPPESDAEPMDQN